VTVFCLFPGTRAISQTITCPTKLLVMGPGFNTSGTFGPGTVQVEVSGPQMTCLYNIFTEWSVKAASASACSSIHIQLTASLPTPYSPPLPAGYSPWSFNVAKTQMSFYQYAKGSCQYAGTATPVSLQSEIPFGYTCTTGQPSTSTFTCTPPSARDQMCLPGQYPEFNANGGQYICVSCTGNTFSNGTQQQCVTCASGTVANSAHNNCNACSGNLVSQGTSCISCPSGDPPNAQHSACLCSANQVSQGSSCASCPSGQVPNAQHTACQCTGNKVTQGSSCVSCPSGEVADSQNANCVPESLSCAEKVTTGLACTGCNAVNPNINWVAFGENCGYVGCCAQGYTGSWPSSCPTSGQPVPTCAKTK
jgi:hypothetical protein